LVAVPDMATCDFMFLRMEERGCKKYWEKKNVVTKFRLPENER